MISSEPLGLGPLFEFSHERTQFPQILGVQVVDLAVDDQTTGVELAAELYLMVIDVLVACGTARHEHRVLAQLK